MNSNSQGYKTQDILETISVFQASPKSGLICKITRFPCIQPSDPWLMTLQFAVWRTFHSLPTAGAAFSFSPKRGERYSFGDEILATPGNGLAVRQTLLGV